MPKDGFEEGYRDGWMSAAGTAPLPDNPTRPSPGEPHDFEAGFRYGRADALELGHTPAPGQPEKLPLNSV